MKLTTKEIMEIIPHRHPFLLIDTIEELVPGVKATGKKCVTYNEPHFAGHFPQEPVMPGVLIVEAGGRQVGVGVLQHGVAVNLGRPLVLDVGIRVQQHEHVALGIGNPAVRNLEDGAFADAAAVAHLVAVVVIVVVVAVVVGVVAVVPAAIVVVLGGRVGVVASVVVVARVVA